jgi:hypothetical protein
MGIHSVPLEFSTSTKRKKTRHHRALIFICKIYDGHQRKLLILNKLDCDEQFLANDYVMKII